MPFDLEYSYIRPSIFKIRAQNALILATIIIKFVDASLNCKTFVC